MPAKQHDDMQRLAGVLHSAAALPLLHVDSSHVGGEPGAYTAAPAALPLALAGSPARLSWSDACLFEWSALQRLCDMCPGVLWRSGAPTL